MMVNGFAKITKIILAIVGVAIIVANIWWRNSKGCRTDLYKSTDSTMADIKRTNESVGSKLRDSREHLERAEEYVDRAADAVGRSEEAAGTNTERTEQLKKLISKSRKLTQENQRIMRDVEAVNLERTEGI